MAKWRKTDYIYFLRKRLDEMEDGDLYSNDELTNLLNESLLDLGNILNVEATANYNLAAEDSVDFRQLFLNPNQVLLPLTDREHNLLEIKSVFINSQRLKSITPEMAENGNRGFYIWAETLNFEEKKSGSLKIYYIKKPKTLVLDTDTTDLPEEFQHIPLDYALAKCRQKDGEYGQYDYDMGVYEKNKQEMKKKMERKKNSTGIYQTIIKEYGE